MTIRAGMLTDASAGRFCNASGGCSTSLSLSQRITGLAVEFVEMLCLDEVHACVSDASQQRDDVRMGGHAFSGHIASTPMISTEGLREASWPYLDAAIGDELELQPIGTEGGQ